MAIREIELDARDMTEDFSAPAADSAQTPELLSPQGFLGGEDDGLDLLSLEELEELAAQQGIVDTPDPESEEDGLEMLSLEELEVLAAQQEEKEAEAAAKAAAEALEPKIEAIPTPLEFTRGEGDTLAQEVSGQAGVTGAIEQAFRPFKERSVISNLIATSKRTEEEQESIFQDMLRADTGALEIDQAIARIEEFAEGRDLTDPELDMLFGLQEQRDDIEQEARENLAAEGRINLEEDMTLSDMVQGIYEQPGEFFRQMANVTSRDPELLLAPVGWAKSAAAAGTVAKVLGATTKATKVAKIVGGNVGVGALAASQAYVIDAAEQLREKGAIDQSQSIDAAIVTAGVASVLTSTIRGGMQVAKSQRQTAAFNQLVDEEFKKFDYSKAADDVIEDTLNNNELFLDSANNIIGTRRTPQPGDLPTQLLEKSKAQLIEEQATLLQNKLAREDRQVMGQHAATLRQEIPRMWQDVLDAEDILNAQTQAFEVSPFITEGRISRNVSAQRGNLRAARATHDSAVVELRSLEEMLLADRDIGLEIVRIAEDNPTKLKGTDIVARAEKIKQEMGPDDLNWLDRRKKLRNEAEEAKNRPKILKLFDGSENKSWEEMGINPEPPSSPTANIVKNVLKPEADTSWNWLVDMTFGKSVSRLDGLAKVSPTAKKLRNIFRHDQEGVQAVPSHPQRVMQSTGKWVSRLEDSMDDLRTSLGGFMKKQEAAEVMDILRGRINKAITPATQQTANNLRKMLDDFLEYAREAGHPVGKIKNFFPRVYHVGRMKKPAVAARFKALLRSKGLDKKRVDEIYQKIISNDGILDFDPKKLTEQRITEQTRPLGSRSLDMVTDLELEEFLSNDLYNVLRDYIHSGVRTVEFSRSFGPNGAKLYDMLEVITKEVKDSGNLMESIELRRIIDLSNALQGSYNRFQSKFAEGMMSSLVTFQQMLSLPFAVLTSATEPFIAISRNRPTSWAEGFGLAMKSASNRSIRTFLKEFPKDQVTREAEGLGLILPASTAEHINSLFGGDFNTKLTAKASAAYFRVTFLTQYTEMTRVWAQQAAKVDIIKSLKILADEGAPWRAEAIKVDLAESGLDIPKGIDWIRRGGDTTDPYYQSVQEASFRDSTKVIMTPDPTNRPIHFSNPQLAFFNMLLSYPTTFTNTAFKNWFAGFTKGNKYYKTQHGAKTAASIGAMMVVSDQMLTLKEWLTYGEEGNPNLINETGTERTIRAANQAGLLGVGQVVGDAYSSVQYGGDAASSRMGPLVGTINDLAEGVFKAPQDDGDSLKKVLPKMFPFLNKSAAARDYIYRNVLQGGRATKEVDVKPLEFKTLTPLRQDLPSIYDRGQRFPEIPVEKKATDDQASVQSGIQEILAMLKEQAAPLAGAALALPLVARAPAGFKPSFKPSKMSLAFQKELTQKGGMGSLHKIIKPELIKEIPQIDRTLKQEMILKKEMQHQLDIAKANDPALAKVPEGFLSTVGQEIDNLNKYLESNKDISSVNTLLDDIIDEVTTDKPEPKIPSKVNEALKEAVVPAHTKEPAPKFDVPQADTILEIKTAKPKEYHELPNEFDKTTNAEAIKQGYDTQMYHYTRAKTVFGEFIPRSDDLHLGNMWNNVGAHVGTPQAARDIAPGGARSGFTLPLAIKRGKEMRNLDGSIMTELEANSVLDRVGMVFSETHGYKKVSDVNAYLRSKGYDSIPYINAVEDKGKVSYILLNKDNVRSALSEFKEVDIGKGGLLLGAAGLMLLGAEESEAGEQSFEADPSPGGVDFDFISEQEGGQQLKAYIPKRKGKAIGQSGVTVATGVDLGQRSAREMKSLGLSPSLMSKIIPYLGKKKDAAVKLLKEKPLNITDAEAEELDNAVHSKIVDDFASKFDAASDVKFDDLSQEAQTVLASVATQYGSDWTKPTKPKNLWKQVTTGDWEGALANLKDFGDEFKNRRNAEAALLEGAKELGVTTTPDQPERPAQTLLQPPTPTPLDEAEMAEEEKFINSLLGRTLDLDEVVRENAARRAPTPTAPPREEPVDIEELFTKASPEVKDMLILKNVFPDASMEEIQEFLEEEANVRNS